MNLPTPRPTSTASTLVGVGLADGCDLERVHTNLGVVHFELAVSSIHNVVNTID